MRLSRLGIQAAVVGAVATAALSAPALAEPNVVTDISPVQSLVARVMAGVGEPTQILPPGASPHGYAMRPSEAAALADADVVFWVGPELTPWLDRAIDTLGTKAEVVELLETPGTTHLAFREGATFEAHHHDGDAHDAHAEEGHDDHAEEGHAEAEGEDHHDAAEEHDHHGTDPHAWLDPDNGKVWLAAIAGELAKADPANADAYRRNAADGARELDELKTHLETKLAPVRGAPFVVFHDGYHYFENRFDIEAAGAVSLSDASKPGPARVSEIRDTIRRLGAVCVFTEPQFQPTLVATIVEGTDARVATLDPLGLDLEPGPGLYPALLTRLADNLATCLD
ncbi:zinc transport system substrate-binding protein [Amorphus suaedae]